MLGWAERLETSGRLGEIERLILQAAFGEYLAQMAGGLAMSQGEIARPADLGIEDAAADFAADPAASRLIRDGNTDALRRRLAELMAEGGFGERALDDESLELVRDQFRRFAEDHREAAHRWHREDVLIPSRWSRSWRRSAFSASPCRRPMAGSASASSPCAW